MKRGEDYDWDNTQELGERDILCGFCGRDISSKVGFTGWARDSRRNIYSQDIYICHKCGKPNFFSVSGKQHPTFRTSTTNFPDAVATVSPRFIEIYKQAEGAEKESMTEIAGPGYGKALEFLLKDHLIKTYPDRMEEIKKAKLYTCIHDILDNPKIRALAEKARIIRNDETHYERIYENTDIQDLKNLIKATAAWIELEHFTSSVSDEGMPKAG